MSCASGNCNAGAGECKKVVNAPEGVILPEGHPGYVAPETAEVVEETTEEVVEETEATEEPTTEEVSE